MNDLAAAAAKFKQMRTPPAEPSEKTPESQPEATGYEDLDTEVSPEGGQPEAAPAPQPRAEEAEPQAEEVTLDAEQLASMLDIEPDSLIVTDEGKVRLRTKVDGEEGDATLKDALERYQRDANLTNRSKELARLKEQADQRNQELIQRTQQLSQQQQILMQELQTELLSPYQGIDWAQLRTDDPAEYAAKRSEISDRQAKIQQMFNQTNNVIQENWAKAVHENQLKTQEYVSEQVKLLPKFIPGWNEKTQTEVSNFLVSEGFTDKEVSSVTDARIVKLAWLAMQQAKGGQKVKESLKKPLPKVLKPGVKPSGTVIHKDQMMKARDQLKKSGKMNDAVALLRTMRKE